MPKRFGAEKTNLDVGSTSRTIPGRSTNILLVGGFLTKREERGEGEREILAERLRERERERERER